MHTNPDVLALLALGEDAGTPAERAHVTTCPACSEEVAELAGIADIGRSSSMPETLLSPSPEVWNRIRAELGFGVPGDVLTMERPHAPSATVSDISSRRVSTLASDGPRVSTAGRRFLALAVAAALALVVGVGVGITYERQAHGPQQRVIARAQLSANPKWPGATGTAEIVTDGRGGRTLVLKMSSPEPVVGSAQVWLANPTATQMQHMGTMKDGTASIALPTDMSLFKFPVVDISDEPPNDTDPGHSGDSILRGELT